MARKMAGHTRVSLYNDAELDIFGETACVISVVVLERIPAIRRFKREYKRP
jgi:hypothetical protein